MKKLNEEKTMFANVQTEQGGILDYIKSIIDNKKYSPVRDKNSPDNDENDPPTDFWQLGETGIAKLVLEVYSGKKKITRQLKWIGWDSQSLPKEDFYDVSVHFIKMQPGLYYAYVLIPEHESCLWCHGQKRVEERLFWI